MVNFSFLISNCPKKASSDKLPMSSPVLSYNVSDCNFEGIEAAAGWCQIFICRSEVTTVDGIPRKLNDKRTGNSILLSFKIFFLNLLLIIKS